MVNIDTCSEFSLSMGMQAFFNDQSKKLFFGNIIDTEKLNICPEEHSGGVEDGYKNNLATIGISRKWIFRTVATLSHGQYFIFVF